MIVTTGIVAAAGAGGQQVATQTEDSRPVTNADTDASLEDGTVTLSVTDESEPVEQVTVSVESESESGKSGSDQDESSESQDRQVGQTDANGTVTFPLGNRSSLEVELSFQQFSGELEYDVTDNSLILLEEEYDYAEEPPEDGDDSEDDRENDADDPDDPDDPDDSDDPDTVDDPDDPDDQRDH
ncbi:MAG: hypothetical protein A07HR60_02511 [uncultured archaeon A07HR60]|nr:MAG: hypothetical protein A07HR60_02511 [uncultured archaeon A07HR60]